MAPATYPAEEGPFVKRTALNILNFLLSCSDRLYLLY
jgi:hypothetical protein